MDPAFYFTIQSPLTHGHLQSIVLAKQFKQFGGERQINIRIYVYMYVEGSKSVSISKCGAVIGDVLRSVKWKEM